MRGNSYWYKLAGSMYGYLEWVIIDSVMYYSKRLNHVRLPTLPWVGSLKGLMMTLRSRNM